MNKNEFEHLINQHKDKLFRFALSILKNNEDAKDAVQEVVLKLWKYKSSLDKTRNTESFCLKAIKNQCLDVIRKQKQQTNYQNNRSGDSFVEPIFENIDLIEILKKELNNLPPQQRIAIELKDFQGYDYEEISEMLDQSINSIRANVSRGRKKLHEIFKEELKNA